MRGYGNFLRGKMYEEQYEKVSRYVLEHKDIKILFLELGIGWRNQLIRVPLMRLAAREPHAFYVTINMGEIFMSRKISEKSYGLDGDLARILHKLAEEQMSEHIFKVNEHNPFRTISRAAALAQAGDVVTVHEGTYREWVKPAQGGRSDSERIVYQAAPGEHVVIKGSEVVDRWEHCRGNMWKTEVQNNVFGGDNPFEKILWGDWLIWPENRKVHAGDVYLNGKSMYEAYNLDELETPVMRTEGYNPPWTKHKEPIPHPEDTLYQWFAEIKDGTTVIYANFQGLDPNQELTEISVRRCCFYPERTGADFIIVRGFEIAQAASPWAPPTADQPGMLGTHWSKGWIIEDNILHDAKCSAVSIGKEYSTGDGIKKPSADILSGATEYMTAGRMGS